MARNITEWPCVEDGQILRLEVRPDHGDRHFLILKESIQDLWENYEVIGKETTLSLSHHFDTIYGVSILAGMDPQTAILVGKAVQEWGEKNC